jgi:hypothetical protein
VYAYGSGKGKRPNRALANFMRGSNADRRRRKSSMFTDKVGTGSAMGSVTIALAATCMIVRAFRSPMIRSRSA